MIRKKVCMLGAFAVGKSSLVRRFVDSVFDERYHTTLGVKIDKASLRCHDQDVELVIWDIEGRDAFTHFNPSYLRGAAGMLLVVDGTRPDTLQTAQAIRADVSAVMGNLPMEVLINKCDLHDLWRLDAATLTGLKHSGWHISHTSAKTGDNVEQAFHRLAHELLSARAADLPAPQQTP